MGRLSFISKQYGIFGEIYRWFGSSSLTGTKGEFPKCLSVYQMVSKLAVIT